MRGLAGNDDRDATERNRRTAGFVRLQVITAGRHQIEMKIAGNAGL